MKVQKKLKLQKSKENRLGKKGITKKQNKTQNKHKTIWECKQQQQPQAIGGKNEFLTFLIQINIKVSINQ